MTDRELAEMTIEDRNRIIDAWVAEVRADIETLAEHDREHSLLDDGPMPGYDAYDWER
jgi:hypothetical protein